MKIKWYDACSKTIPEDSLKHINEHYDGKELLEINTTYGKLFKKLKHVVILITEESSVKETEVTIIPRGWIISPEELKWNI